MLGGFFLLACRLPSTHLKLTLAQLFCASSSSSSSSSSTGQPCLSPLRSARLVSHVRLTECDRYFCVIVVGSSAVGACALGGARGAAWRRPTPGVMAANWTEPGTFLAGRCERRAAHLVCTAGRKYVVCPHCPATNELLRGVFDGAHCWPGHYATTGCSNWRLAHAAAVAEVATARDVLSAPTPGRP